MEVHRSYLIYRNSQGRFVFSSPIVFPSLFPSSSRIEEESDNCIYNPGGTANTRHLTRAAVLIAKLDARPTTAA